MGWVRDLKIAKSRQAGFPLFQNSVFRAGAECNDLIVAADCPEHA
jgi:hypothetical protein